MMSADGVLYAANSLADGGMERCLNPSYTLGPTFETVTPGLDDGATLFGLWQCDHRLWSIDTTNTRLMTYIDSLTLPVTLTSPSERAPGIGIIIDSAINGVTLDWEVSDGATDYEWQLDYDTNFSSVPVGFEGDTTASSARLPTLEPATTYYWRVRATEPVLSPWSDKWSFTTSLGSAVVAPALYSPGAAVSGVPLEPIFQWGAIAGADSYELMVSTDASFIDLVIEKTGDYALSGTAWQSDISLEYDSTYYWKVRANSSGSCSAWSAVGIFTTVPLPVLEASSQPTSPQPAQAPPVLPASSSASPPDWLIYVVAALVLTIILMFVIILVLILRVRVR